VRSLVTASLGGSQSLTTQRTSVVREGGGKFPGREVGFSKGRFSSDSCGDGTGQRWRDIDLPRACHLA